MKNKRSMMESEYDIKDIVIIDNGTDTVKVGISGEDYPKLIYDNCCGTPAIQQDNDNTNNKPQLLFGSTLKSALNENKSPISLSYPIQDGRIDDLDKIRDFWAYCFEEGLQISELTQVNVLVIDQVKNSKDYKYKLSEILFQDLKVQSVLFMNASTLSLFATGAVTGLSIELGHAVNTVVPIYQGFPLPHALQYSDISGNAVSQALLADLKESQITFEQYAELDSRWLIKDIKEHMCYVAQDYEREISLEDYFSEEDRSYQLPDEQIIQITPKMRYRCGESIFNSSILGKNNLTLPEMISDSVGRCDSELQQELCSNIVLGGGSSMYQGLIPRLKKEVQRLLPRITQNYVADFQRMYSAWIGGSMLGSLSTFQSLAITRAEYEENPEGKQSIIHKLKIIILAGYLGAGKTTLIQYILRVQTDFKIAIIQNEFSDEMGIEAPLFKDPDGQTFDMFYEMPNGCVCCSAKGELLQAVEFFVKKRPELQFIIIESNGLADPSALIQQLWIDKELEIADLNSIISIIPTHRVEELHSNPIFLKQLIYADTIIMNYLDKASTQNISILEELIKEINPTADIQHSEYAKTTIDIIFQQNQTFSLSQPLTNIIHSNFKSIYVSEKISKTYNEWQHSIGTLLWEKPYKILRIKGLLQVTNEQFSYQLQGVNDTFEIVQTDQIISLTKILIVGEDIDQSDILISLQQ